MVICILHMLLRIAEKGLKNEAQALWDRKKGISGKNAIAEFNKFLKDRVSQRIHIFAPGDATEHGKTSNKPKVVGVIGDHVSSILACAKDFLSLKVFEGTDSLGERKYDCIHSTVAHPIGNGGQLSPRSRVSCALPPPTLTRSARFL